MRPQRALLIAATAVAGLIAFTAPQTATAAQPAHHHANHSSAATLLTSGLAGGGGSTIGPDGALYVTEALAGRITRVDPATGAKTTYASGLPTRVIPLGGTMDVAFVDGTAYVLVTLVGADVGGTNTVGIYRIDSTTTHTVVADIGTWATTHPPATAFEVPSGVQYALQPWRGDLLVTDGHHNRVLLVDLDGKLGSNVSQVIAFGDIVPTGMARQGHTLYLAEAGPVPHLATTGKVVRFEPGDATATDVASGAPLNVDVEFGPGHHGRTLYALSQGTFHAGDQPGSPAMPDTGSILRVNADGTMTTVTTALDRPTSLEIVGHRAYVVTLDGEIWTADLGGSGHDD
ncbi:ScyD/ScyE family protein [Nocardioides sp. LS1]|uniref:ScyD/ScyE family protein n=1 Tax=Nocardioides sp. LS1 TaxID=1027620 RepID=UPI000F6196FA|nr:ScyD/ScyE family protein [Nocardioides sp. LS1]GCD91448.1 hypothetical protein NLS1_34540 [Nocardioides sp. LS1]